MKETKTVLKGEIVLQHTWRIKCSTFDNGFYLDENQEGNRLLEPQYKPARPSRYIYNSLPNHRRICIL